MDIPPPFGYAPSSHIICNYMGDQNRRTWGSYNRRSNANQLRSQWCQSREGSVVCDAILRRESSKHCYISQHLETLREPGPTQAGLTLCSSQPARDWKSCFFFIFSFFFILIIIFWLENYHFLFIPVKFFHYLFIPVFHPFGIFIFLSFASKMVLGPWELPPEAFSRTLFVCFFDCFCALAIFLSYAFKIDLGNCQKELFLEAFSFFSRVGIFSFLCL